MKIILKLIAVAILLPLAPAALVIYRTTSYQAAVCDRIQKISQDSNLREYLTTWVLETYGEPHAENGVPEEFVPVGFGWNRLNIDPKFATFSINLTKVTVDDSEEDAYLVAVGEGRDEVLLLVTAQPISKQVTLHQAISPEYKEVKPGVWYFCD